VSRKRIITKGEPIPVQVSTISGHATSRTPIPQVNESDVIRETLQVVPPERVDSGRVTFLGHQTEIVRTAKGRDVLVRFLKEGGYRYTTSDAAVIEHLRNKGFKELA
jgi:hypothetical protein